MRKFVVGVLAAGLTSLLIFFAIASALSASLTANHLKQWLASHHVYDQLVDNALSQNQNFNVGSGNDQVSINQPEVQTAIKQTFTPQLLQKTTEQFIDGTEPWLTGKSPKPTFQIDLSNLKTQLAQNITDTARTRYNNLPACTRFQLPTITNPLSISCRVPGVNIDTELTSLKADIVASRDFLPNPVITADNLNFSSTNGGINEPFYQKLHSLPQIYQWLHRSPYILAALALIIILLIIFSSSLKRRGVRRIASCLLVAGLLLVIFSLLINGGLNKADQKILTSTASNQITLVKTSILPIIKEVQHAILNKTIIFGIVYAVVAIGLAIYLKLSRKPSSKSHKSAVNRGGPPKPPSRPKPERTLVSG